jgi:hypothetical protein
VPVHSNAVSVKQRIHRVDMRTVTRYPLLQRCFVHPVKTAETQAWRCVAYNSSALGIGVALPVQLPTRTLLTIHACNLPRACPLEVRVIHAKPVDMFWFTGCEMLRRLSEEELRIWCSGPLDWVDNPQA